MLQWIIGRIFRRRHYWRNVSFDEVAELYVSRLIMVFAVNIVGLFMALYLYELGYSVLFILILYGAVFALKAPLRLCRQNTLHILGPSMAC